MTGTSPTSSACTCARPATTSPSPATATRPSGSCKEQPFDLAVLDIMMPGPDGLQIVRHLRRRSELPVIFLSARSSDVDKVAGLQFGADDYVTKPFNPAELVARVQSVLRRSRAAAEPQARRSRSASSGWTSATARPRIRGDADRPDAEGVRPPRHVRALPQRHARPREAARPRLGHVLLRHAHRRRAHRPPAQQARRLRPAHRDGVGQRLPARRGGARVMARVRSFLFSFQTKLVLAMTGVIIIAILLAGAVFVARDRADSQERALERVAAASPARLPGGAQALIRRRRLRRSSFAANARRRSPATRMSASWSSSSEDSVLHDTGGDLDRQLSSQIPELPRRLHRRGFVAWEPATSDSRRQESDVRVARRPLGDPLRRHRAEAASRAVPHRPRRRVRHDRRCLAGRAAVARGSPRSSPSRSRSSSRCCSRARSRNPSAGSPPPPRRWPAATSTSASRSAATTRSAGSLARSPRWRERVGERDQQMRALLANVSHDLKTPMTSITGYAQALTDGTADPEDVPRIGARHRRRSASTSTACSTTCCTSARSTPARSSPAARTSRWTRSSAAACAASSRSPTAKSIEIAVDVEPGPHRSATSTPTSSSARSRTCWRTQRSSRPRTATITVVARRENGVAIGRAARSPTPAPASPTDDLPRIFDRFFRGDRARRTAAGSGLGLAITRELVELNGGRIAARNEPAGAGVTFTLTFPHVPQSNLSRCASVIPSAADFGSRRSPTRLLPYTSLATAIAGTPSCALRSKTATSCNNGDAA